jgi:hypothetical protein
MPFLRPVIVNWIPKIVHIPHDSSVAHDISIIDCQTNGEQESISQDIFAITEDIHSIAKYVITSLYPAPIVGILVTIDVTTDPPCSSLRNRGGLFGGLA